jgi:anti-sigma factor RsiW
VGRCRSRCVAGTDDSRRLRSLEPGHLADVASTDQHTVKPWFAGRLEFSPPVIDAASAGFPLVGGRTDVVGRQRLAALVYSHHGHVINLFIRPRAKSERNVGPPIAIHGYNLLQWGGRDLQFAAISDLNATELRRFAVFVRATAP